MRGKGDKNVCWRPEHLLKGFLKSETQHGLKWRNEGFYMCQLSFTKKNNSKEKFILTHGFRVSDHGHHGHQVICLYRCGPRKADAHDSECMWQRGLFTHGGRKQKRRKAKEPTSCGFYYHTTPPYVSYQTFSSWPLGDISDPNSLSFISILCKNTSCLHSMAFKALTILVLLKSLLKKIKVNS